MELLQKEHPTFWPIQGYGRYDVLLIYIYIVSHSNLLLNTGHSHSQ